MQETYDGSVKVWPLLNKEHCNAAFHAADF
eukprot:COSAG05_NODE_15013_length_380_cov_1.466192_1_plen_29_part_10